MGAGRSLLSAITVFLIFRENRSWMTEDQIYKPFLIETLKELRHQKRAGRCRTAAIDSTAFFAHQRCRKTATLAVTFWIWQVESFCDQQTTVSFKEETGAWAAAANLNNSNRAMTSVTPGWGSADRCFWIWKVKKNSPPPPPTLPNTFKVSRDTSFPWKRKFSFFSL